MLNITVNNLDVVLTNIKNASEQIQAKIDNELNAFGLGTVADAKRFAPVDEGVLRNSISLKKEKLKVTVTVGVNYAAYLEFGTRKFAASYVSSLPQDWQTFANGFKGKGGGDMEEFIKRLVEWVKRKGIAGVYSVKSRKRMGTVVKNIGTTKQGQDLEDYEAAYGIALHIIRNGIRPHPFLYPAYEKNRVELIANLKSALDAK